MGETSAQVGSSPDAGSALWWSRLTLRVFAVSFALGALSFFVAPNRTVRFLNAVGAALGDFPPAPESDLRLWVSLATGYMVLVTALAWLAQRDLPRRRDLVGLLILGKAVTSCAALLVYLFHARSFVYLANFVVDGAITLAAVAIWRAIPSFEPSTTTSRGRDHFAAVFGALLDAMIPAGGPFPEGASGLLAWEDIEAFLGGRKSGGARAFRVGLQLFDLSPFVLPPLRFRRFAALSVEERVRILDSWEASRWVPRRQAIHALKLLVMPQFYSRLDVEARLGYPRPLVRVPRREVAP